MVTWKCVAVPWMLTADVPTVSPFGLVIVLV
jgi:hypothetical protein